MPRQLSSFNQAQKMVGEFNRSMGLTRSTSRRALQRRSSNLKESSRSQRYRLSDEDSDDDDDNDNEDASQEAAERYVSMLFGPKRKGKEKVVEPVDTPPAGLQIKVKHEQTSTQPSTHQKSGPSKTQKDIPIIDLTFQTTDDEAPRPTTQKSKSATRSSASNSQRSTTTGKTMVKKKKRTPSANLNGSVDQERLKRMMSGGSGKSEGDSIVLLDTDEEDITAKSAVPKPLVKPSPSRLNGSASKNQQLKPPPAASTLPDPPSSHRATLAEWRNTAPSSSSTRQLSKSNSSSSLLSHPTRSSQPNAPQLQKPPPLLYKEPPTSSPSKGRSPPKTSQTSDGLDRDHKRMELAPPFTEDDIDMDRAKGSASENAGLRPATEETDTIQRRTSRGTSLVLEVEIPLPVRRSSRTPVRNPSQSHIGKSPLRIAAASPLREGLTRQDMKTPTNATNKTSTKTPAKTPLATASKTAIGPMQTPAKGSLTPQSSTLSSVSSRSASRTPQQTPRVTVTDEQFDRLASLVRDVPVKYSDGIVPEELRQAAPELLTPTKHTASPSSRPRPLGKSESLVAPVSQRSHHIFGSSPSRLSATSSLPPKSHRDLFAVLSPSQRASMDRPVSVRPLPKSVHLIRHQDLLANDAEKRKVPGTPIVEENTVVDSPSKRRHLSPPEEPAAAAPIVATARHRRAKPVFASLSPGRPPPSAAMPISPARSIRTDRGTAPNTPSKFGSFASFHMSSTSQASPMQEYDTDRSYVSSSVMEEKMPVLIPYERPKVVAPVQEDDKMEVTDELVVGVDVRLTEDVYMTEEVDENVDLMDMFGDFDWTSDQPQPPPAETSDTVSTTTPISKSVEEADESLIDSVLHHSPTQSLGTGNISREITSPGTAMTTTADSNAAADNSRREAAGKKALDIFAELKAQHEQEESERRQKEEAARKKALEDTDEDDSEDDLTSLLVNTKPRASATTLEEDKAKPYGLRSSREPTAVLKAVRKSSAVSRASPLPAALVKLNREMKKEKRSKGGMSAMEIAKLNLELLEDEQEAEAAEMTARLGGVLPNRPEPVEEEDSDGSGTEEDDIMEDSEDEIKENAALDMLSKELNMESANPVKEVKRGLRRPRMVDDDDENTALADIPCWQGVWEDLKTEQADLQVTIPDLQTALPGYAPFAKNPRLLMAVLPSMAQKAGKEASNILINITTVFPTHPIANAAIRIFGEHAPDAYDPTFWNHHLVRIGEKYGNDPMSRVQATIHWLECLAVLLKRSEPRQGMGELVVSLVKLAIDRGSDFVLRWAVTECIQEAVKDASDESLMAIAGQLAEFSRPYAARKMRVRIADALGVVSPRARTLKRMFGLQCLADSTKADVKKVTLPNLPRLIKENALPSLATTSDSPRGVLSAARMTMETLTQVHDAIYAVGDAGLREKDKTMSVADAGRSDWVIRKEVGAAWREEIMDALRWLKSGMLNKGKRTSAFRQMASLELGSFLNRFEQSSKYYLDTLRPAQSAGAGFFKVKSEGATPARGGTPVNGDAAGVETRDSSVFSRYESSPGPGPGPGRPAGRPKPMRRVVKAEG